MGASVLSVSSRALLDACARLGLNTTQILQAAKVDPATLANPDARIPIEQVDELWRKAYQLARDPDLALHAIEVLPFGATASSISLPRMHRPSARRSRRCRIISH